MAKDSLYVRGVMCVVDVCQLVGCITTEDRLDIFYTVILDTFLTIYRDLSPRKTTDSLHNAACSVT